MPNIIHLSIKGKIQGLVSEGCGSYVPTGNKYQTNHVDEIFVLQFDHSLSQGYNVVHRPIKFYKPINKSPPLPDATLSENEELSAVLNFYRVSSGGCIKRFHTIELQEAHLSSILTYYPHSVTYTGNQPEGIIVLSYKNTTWRHHIASTGSCSCWEERVFQV